MGTAPAPDQVVATRLPAREYDELAARATKADRTIAAELRRAVRAYLKSKDGGKAA